MKNISYQKIKHDFKGKKVLILGLGLLGKGINDCEFFCRLGAKVRVSDLKDKRELGASLSKIRNLPLEYSLGGHKKGDIRWADLIVKSPAVKDNSVYIKYARTLGKKISMDTTLFCAYFPGKCIGVSGTRGKSTVSYLIYSLLKNAGNPVMLAGNIANQASLPLLKTASKDTWTVLELSSWDLAGLADISFSPYIAVMTNIYPDHLNWYKTMKEYIADKKNISNFQTKDDYLLLNSKQPLLLKWAEKSKAKVIVYKDDKLCPKSRLKGQHNRENIAAVKAVSKLMKIKNSYFQKTVSSFAGLPFRQEKISSINGVDYINDTTSTTPIATIMAILNQDKPFYIILGGFGKNLPDEKMLKLAGEKAKGIALVEGIYTPIVKRKLEKMGFAKKIISYEKDLIRLLSACSKRAVSGEAVLFSPGYASFGLFENEFDRGKKFNKAVSALKNVKKEKIK